MKYDFLKDPERDWLFNNSEEFLNLMLYSILIVQSLRTILLIESRNKIEIRIGLTLRFFTLNILLNVSVGYKYYSKNSIWLLHISWDIRLITIGLEMKREMSCI